MFNTYIAYSYIERVCVLVCNMLMSPVGEYAVEIESVRLLAILQLIEMDVSIVSY